MAISLAAAGGTAISVLGAVSSANGVLNACKGIIEAIEVMEIARQESRRLAQIARLCCHAISLPAHHRYLEDDFIQSLAERVIHTARQAIQWIEKYQTYGRVRRFCSAASYERRFATYERQLVDDFSMYSQTCQLRNLGTASQYSAGSDASERGLLDLKESSGDEKYVVPVQSLVLDV